MNHEDIYINDIKNRFPNFTLTKSINESITTFELLDGTTVVARASGGNSAGTMFKLRFNLIGGLDILPLLTPTQREQLTKLTRGQEILTLMNNGKYRIEFYDGTVWKTITR